MRLRVDPHVPRNAPGGKTEEGNHIPWNGAGKPSVGVSRRLAEASWPARGVEDPWGNAKAARWMLPAGQVAVRAGLLAWQRAREHERSAPRERGVLVTGVEGAWPDWLKGRGAAQVAGEWRAKPPLWLLECLPNLPAAQLAIEIGAKGPVESRRSRRDDEASVARALGRWQRRGVRTVLVVRLTGEAAKAEVWSL